MPRDEPELGKGPRLFAGDFYTLARKYGVPQKSLQNALMSGPMVFTITGTSESDESRYVRLHFQCPPGVYVDTRRAEDIQVSGVSLIAPSHKHLTISRRVGESFQIRPFPGREAGAARDLFERGVLVRAEEDGIADIAVVHIYASDCWEILRGELVGGLTVLERPVVKTEEVSPDAFRQAAEKLLDQDQLAKINDLARAITRQDASWRP